MKNILNSLQLIFIMNGFVYAQPIFLHYMPYSSFAGSPFKDKSFLYFYLEDFEDGLLNTPGVSVNQGNTVIGDLGLKSKFVDSVDADDGKLDGAGSGGHSLWSRNNSSVVFVFDEQVLGKLPTHVGIVWTDGPIASMVTLSAFDGKGASIGRSNPMRPGDNVITGTVGEDCFFGMYNKSGIEKVVISNLHSDFEVDHLQYGLELSCRECNQEHSIPNGTLEH